MTNGIKVAVLGFSNLDQEKFRKIFRFTRSRRRSYAYCPDAVDCDPDILIVNDDTGSIEHGKHGTLAKKHCLPVVLATKRGHLDLFRQQTNGSVYSARVLQVLDRIEIEKRNSKRRRKTRHPVTPQSQVSNGNIIDERTLYPVMGKLEKRPLTHKESPAFDVLVVDDSPSMQKMLALEFAQTVMETRVRAVETGEQALECIAEGYYDFIFLDVMMPGIDGYETCSRIRKYPGMKKTPIIMLSAKTSPLDEVKGIMAGCTTYITKPIKHEEFQKVVERILHWLDEYRQSAQPMVSVRNNAGK